MSSATVLFVLRHILEQDSEPGDERICSMAFGPGLTVETALLTKLRQVPAAAGDPAGTRQEELLQEIPVA